MADRPLWNKIINRLSDFHDISELEDLYTNKESDNQKYISHRMLVTYRNYVIKYLKAPLLKAIVDCGLSKLSWLRLLISLYQIARHIKKYPTPTKENTRNTATHTMLDIEDKFFSYLKMRNRKELFKAIYKLSFVQCEHDGYYEAFRDWWIEEIIKAILEGKWPPRNEGWPPKYWKEPAPYGGKYSIVFKMFNHRHEILKILEEA